MKDEGNPSNYQDIKNNNYIINAYLHLIKIDFIHFIISLIEIIMNILQEWIIFVNKNNNEEKSKNNFIYFIITIPDKINSLSTLVKIVIIILYSLIFDISYIFLTRRDLSKKYAGITFLVNFLEFFYFRISMLLSLNILFSLNYVQLIFLLILFFPHINLIRSHFSYNHLYYFVPIFIKYPYDEFSSIYDSVLLLFKIFLSIMINTKLFFLKNFIYITLFIMHIFFSFYFLNLLFNQSYLFMKNQFLNLSKLSLFFVQTFILIITEAVGHNEIINIWYLIIVILLFAILLLYINLLYEPKNYIRINSANQNENLFYYFYIISDKNEFNFLIESKINEHYEKCNVCSLCSKYKKYSNKLKLNFIDDNYKENNIIINNNEVKDLFYVLYEHKNNYFKLINEIVLDYKYNKKKFLINSSYYYINLSFLIFSEFKNNNITLSLNIKLLLYVINKENKFIDNEAFQIHQIMFCNAFISLSNKILGQLKNILIEEYDSAKKYIELSDSLNEMQMPKVKDELYNYKQDGNSTIKNIILICSILFEEIFNITINSSQIPIRENNQIYEDIFMHNYKNDKIITLAVNLINYDCKIIRAGKDLFQYKDDNLFDLFPLIFRDHQIKIFFSKIKENFNSNTSNNKFAYMKLESMHKKATVRFGHDHKAKSKKNENDYIEIKLIICESICKKMFYKLLILKISPLFNFDFNSYYLLFDGTFNMYKKTILIFENREDTNNRSQKIISVSQPDLEEPPEIYSMKFSKYLIWLEKNGHILTKIFEHNFLTKIYTMYAIVPKDHRGQKKISRQSIFQRESIGDIDVSDFRSNFGIKKQVDNLIQENSSVASHQLSNNYVMASSGYGLKNRKKENVYRYSSLYKIKNTLMISIPFILLTYILEIIHLNHLRDENINNDYSIVKFDEIYKIYFQLFSSTLSTACIKMKDGCKSIASNRIKNYENFNNFNFSNFLSAQIKLFAHELLLKKNNLIKIHQNIGNEKYKQIFEYKINYTRIGRLFINGDLALIPTNISIPFSEAILIACNSFQIMVNNTNNEPVYILNKKKDPFFYLTQGEIKAFSDYQKEISEMILNYKIYKDQFININQKFINTLAEQSQKIELYIYLYFHLTLLICVYILSLLYIYLLNFEQIIIKILNYVNMIKNSKNDDNFNFSEIFLQKIKNLEIILNIYIENPFKALEDLNKLYAKHQKIAIQAIKNQMNYISKKKNQKIIQEEKNKDELDMVPKNLKVFKKTDIRKLNIMYYYLLFLFLICICIFAIYIIILYIWINYSKVKTSLYSLISKNLELEISLYKTMNLYDLIIFNNLTIEELSTDVFYSPEKKIYNKATLLNSFYDDLHIAFNYEAEIKILRKNFKSFPFFNFTCENLYELNSNYIFELANYSFFKNISDVKNQLKQICNLSRLAEYNDINAVFQSHYQEIKNSIVFIVDNSLQGLINHLNEGKLGKVSLHFNCILLYLLNIVSNQMHQIEIGDLILLLKENLSTTLIVTIFLYVILIILVRLFYIRKLKKYCNQVILLKKVFQISEIQEQ